MDPYEDFEDYSDEDADYAEFGWCKELRADVVAQNSERAGSCTARLIDRDRIRTKIYTEMDEISNDTSELAFGIFDRWGFLKPDLSQGP